MKKNIGILLVVTFALVMGLIMTACDNSGGVCEKRDLAVDDAAGTCGKGTCTCAVKEYGKVNGIPVYRLKAVTDAQAKTAMTNLTAGFNTMGDAPKTNITTNNISAFHIGGAVGWNAVEKIQTIKFDWNAETMRDLLEARGGMFAFFKQFMNDFRLA